MWKNLLIEYEPLNDKWEYFIDNLLEFGEADVVDFTEALVDVVLVLTVLSLDTFLILVLLNSIFKNQIA